MLSDVLCPYLVPGRVTSIWGVVPQANSPLHPAIPLLQAVASLPGDTSAAAAMVRRKPAGPKRTGPTAASAPAPAAGARCDPAAGKTRPTGSGRVPEAGSDNSGDDVPLIKLYDPDR